MKHYLLSFRKYSITESTEYMLNVIRGICVRIVCLNGVCLHGAMAMGCFQPNKSDIEEAREDILSNLVM